MTTNAELLKKFSDREAKWDERFLRLAAEIATWSKDKSRQTACVIVGDGRKILATGYNGFPRGVNDDVPERHTRERDIKYKFTEHAERNAIYQAAEHGIALRGSAIYLPWYPCADCARAIVQSGIKFLIGVEPDWSDPKYAFDFICAREILAEGGVMTRYVRGWKSPEQKQV